MVSSVPDPPESTIDAQVQITDNPAYYTKTPDATRISFEFQCLGIFPITDKIRRWTQLMWDFVYLNIPTILHEPGFHIKIHPHLPNWIQLPDGTCEPRSDENAHLPCCS